MTMSAVAGNATEANDRLSDPGQGVRLKVCGATVPAEIDTLAAQAVDFVGLWYGVPRRAGGSGAR